MRSHQGACDSSQADALVKRAVDNQCAGQLEAAAALYRQALQQAPQHAAANHFFGILLHQLGDSDAALQRVTHSIALCPTQVEWINDLGNLLAALGRNEDAAKAFMDAVQCEPRHAVAWNNLGAMLLRCAQPEEALQCFSNALMLDAAFEDAYNNLGQAQTQLGLHLEAARSYCQAFVLHPDPDKSLQALGTAYYVLGRTAEAAQIYSDWLQREPGHPVAAHMLAACTGEDVPERASDAYLETVFDQAAGQFDRKMTDTLSYHVPALIGEIVADIAGPARRLSILDAGCGTGLCGQHLAPHAQHLVGVDLSGKSLDLAATKGSYSRLVKQEIVEYLSQAELDFDLAVAADTYIYFGDLAPLLQAMASRLAPGGWLIATAETRPDLYTGYAITPSGRYCHSRDYLWQHYRAAGFDEIDMRPIQLRVELEQPVPGLLLLARYRNNAQPTGLGGPTAPASLS